MSSNDIHSVLQGVGWLAILNRLPSVCFAAFASGTWREFKVWQRESESGQRLLHCNCFLAGWNKFQASRRSHRMIEPSPSSACSSVPVCLGNCIFMTLNSEDGPQEMMSHHRLQRVLINPLIPNLLFGWWLYWEILAYMWIIKGKVQQKTHKKRYIYYKIPAPTYSTHLK